MSWKDLPDFPQDIPEIPSMGTPDEIDEMWHNAEHSMPARTIKPFTGKNERPLRRMERQHLPSDHKDFIPYEERMYRFFRDYRLDVEHGRIACSNEQYRSVLTYEDYYKSLVFEETEIFNGIASYVKVDISAPESRRAFLIYHWSKSPEIREEARKTLLRYTKRGQLSPVVDYAMEQAGMFGGVAV